MVFINGYDVYKRVYFLESSMLVRFLMRYSCLKVAIKETLFPLCFLIAAEILAESIRVKKTIKGITLFDKDFKISQYADDTSLYI